MITQCNVAVANRSCSEAFFATLHPVHYSKKHGYPENRHVIGLATLSAARSTAAAAQKVVCIITPRWLNANKVAYYHTRTYLDKSSGNTFILLEWILLKKNWSRIAIANYNPYSLRSHFSCIILNLHVQFHLVIFPNFKPEFPNYILLSSQLPKIAYIQYTDNTKGSCMHGDIGDGKECTWFW